MPTPAAPPPDTPTAIYQAQKHVPVDLVGLAKTLEIQIKSVPMHDSVAGEIIRDGSDTYTCVLNSMHRPIQQRFTLAHQMGHYVLHREILGQGISDTKDYAAVPGSTYYNSRISEHDEADATAFALGLLIPPKALDRFKDLGLSVEQMADKFQVETWAVDACLRPNPVTTDEWDY